MNAKLFILLFTAVLGFLFSSCYSGSISEDPELHNQIAEQWLQRTYKNPKDTEALKNLGIFYVQANDHFKANIYLDRALKELPEDPALHFYKGLNLEFFNKNDEALQYYSIYSKVSEDDQYREMLEGRYLWLQRQNAYADIKAIINNESQTAAAVASDSAIAVFPLLYRGIKTDYVPLSRGFSEMISIDLAKVKSLTVLERVRIQALLDEIRFAGTGLADQSTVPRAGKILKAGEIVSGEFDIPNDKDFTISMGSWNSSTSEQKVWVTKSGSLSDLFSIQKEIVFSFLQKSGIETTQEEKEQIAYIPTQNLESFLAFSNGLLAEDAGNFDEANIFYRKAAELDPGFGTTIMKIGTTSAVKSGGGEKSNVVSKMESEDPVTKRIVGSLDAERFQSLGTNIISGFMPGSNNRSPSEEWSILEGGKLPEPPPPPIRN